MGAGFVVEVAGHLKLERGVLQVEMAGQAGLEPIEELRRVAFPEAGFVDHDMGGESGQARGDRPGVQVMDVGDVARFEEMGSDIVEVHALGCGFE